MWQTVVAHLLSAQTPPTARAALLAGAGETHSALAKALMSYAWHHDSVILLHHRRQVQWGMVVPIS
jgi:hypothetical protein